MPAPSQIELSGLSRYRRGSPDSSIGHGATLQAGRAEHAVEPRVIDHLDDRLDAAAFLADEPCFRGAKLELGRRVGAVAELVLQPLDPEALLTPRHEEAREAAGRLREHEEDVRHRRRAEPLVPVEPVHPVVGRLSRRRVRADVRPALALGHRHPAERTPVAVAQ